MSCRPTSSPGRHKSDDLSEAEEYVAAIMSSQLVSKVDTYLCQVPQMQLQRRLGMGILSKLKIQRTIIIARVIL